MSQPIQLPVHPAARHRVRSFSIAPVPDHPERVAWACEDCTTSDTAHNPTQLGAQLSAHLAACDGRPFGYG